MRCAAVALGACAILGAGIPSARAAEPAIPAETVSAAVIVASAASPMTMDDAVRSVGTPPDAARIAPALQKKRPGSLIPLYVSYATLQALDAHSTLQATRSGLSEANPIVDPVAHHSAAMIAAKAATATATILLTERLWRRHPVAAVLLMVGVNAGYAAVVANNYRATR